MSGGRYGWKCMYLRGLFRQDFTVFQTSGKDKVKKKKQSKNKQAIVRWSTNSFKRARQKSELGKPELELKFSAKLCEQHELLGNHRYKTQRMYFEIN